ncbi:hypothetical protein J4Q44_G00299740, partial [Coregonus suidteri]
VKVECRCFVLTSLVKTKKNKPNTAKYNLAGKRTLRTPVKYKLKAHTVWNSLQKQHRENKRTSIPK